MTRCICVKCKNVLGEHMLTAYGEPICTDCWDSYICTPEGKLEYLIGICLGDYPATEFDNEFLLEVVASWNEHKEQVRAQLPDQLFKMCEIRAQVLAKL